MKCNWWLVLFGGFVCFGCFGGFRTVVGFLCFFLFVCVLWVVLGVLAGWWYGGFSVGRV